MEKIVALRQGAASQPRPINIWLESLTSQVICGADDPPALTEAKAQKDEAILILLGKLALVYWRPEFTPKQAAQLYEQYLDDLREFAFADVRDAIERYRRNVENKFFPTPGQLRGLIEAVPSWDVISKREHMRQLRQAAERELATISTDLGTKRVMLGNPG